MKRAGHDSRVRRVVILYKDLPHYRVGFFDALRERLRSAGVEVALIHGQAVGESATKRDKGELDWAQFVPNRIVRAFGTQLIWQPVLSRLHRDDLVVVEQANKLLVNYLLLALDRIGFLRVAFWGHGRNFQTRKPTGAAERFKKAYSSLPSWWFAYNETSARVVREIGFPAERITVVQNAIDTTALGRSIRNVDRDEIERARTERAIRGANVCLFVGGMYSEKRLAFLLEAAEAVSSCISDFELVLIGAGPDEGLAREADRRHEWAHYLGPLFGEELAPYLAMARLILMPGVVGLGVLDSFAAGVPMVTIDSPNHGPEIEYLQDDVNGVVMPADTSAPEFGAEVVALLSDGERYDEISEACRLSASRYTVEEMADRFAAGVLSALERG